MSRSDSLQRRESSLPKLQWTPGRTAVVLSFVGGMVDGVGYLNLGHLFIGFMSGNSIKLGIHLGQGQWHEALRFLLPIVLFLLGVALGGMLSELAARWSIRTPQPLLLGIEALLIAGYMFCGNWLIHGGKLFAPQEFSWSFALLLMLLTGAMGIQTAALQHIGSHSVHTTFITGMLLDLARQSVSFLLRSGKGPESHNGGVPETPQPAWSWLLVEIWGGYVAGAVAGTYGLNHISIKVLLIPLLLLLFLIVMSLRRTTGPASG